MASQTPTNVFVQITGSPGIDYVPPKEVVGSILQETLDGKRKFKVEARPVHAPKIMFLLQELLKERVQVKLHL